MSPGGTPVTECFDGAPRDREPRRGWPRAVSYPEAGGAGPMCGPLRPKDRGSRSTVPRKDRSTRAAAWRRLVPPHGDGLFCFILEGLHIRTPRRSVPVGRPAACGEAAARSPAWSGPARPRAARGPAPPPALWTARRRTAGLCTGLGVAVLVWRSWRGGLGVAVLVWRGRGDGGEEASAGTRRRVRRTSRRPCPRGVASPRAATLGGTRRRMASVLVGGHWVGARGSWVAARALVAKTRRSWDTRAPGEARGGAAGARSPLAGAGRSPRGAAS